jgi:hypothetical protein
MKKRELDLEELGYRAEADFSNPFSMPSLWYFVFTSLFIIGITVGGVSYVRSTDEIQDNKINAYVFREPVPVDEAKAEEVKSAMLSIEESVSENSTSVFDDGIFDGLISDKTRAANMLATNSVWAQSSSAFLTVVLDNIPDNGFTSNISTLNQVEIENIWNILKEN